MDRVKIKEFLKIDKKIRVREVNTVTITNLQVFFKDDYGKNALKDEIFELMSVIYHTGKTPDGGHYYSYQKKTSGWLYCNDHVVIQFLSDVEI